MTYRPKRQMGGFNRLIWEAQPHWAKVAEAVVAFPAIALLAFTAIFDRDDQRGLMLYGVIALSAAGMAQLFFFVRACLNDEM